MRLYTKVQFLLCGMGYRIAAEIYLGIARYYCFQRVAQCVTLVDENKCARAITVFLITSQLKCINLCQTLCNLLIASIFTHVFITYFCQCTHFKRLNKQFKVQCVRPVDLTETCTLFISISLGSSVAALLPLIDSHEITLLSIHLEFFAKR